MCYTVAAHFDSAELVGELPVDFTYMLLILLLVDFFIGVMRGIVAEHLW